MYLKSAFVALIIKKGQRDIIKFYTALIQGRSENCTHGYRSLTTLLVKHNNDLLDRQSSGRGRDKVSYFYDGNVFLDSLALCMAIFKKKSS